MLGTTTLGQVALGGDGVVDDGISQVDCSAYIQARSTIAVATSAIRQIAARISSTSSVSVALGAGGIKSASASLLMYSSFTAEISMISAPLDAGVLFVISDKAGGA